MEKRFLKTPMVAITGKWNSKANKLATGAMFRHCEQEDLPYAKFIKYRKYGAYSCDLIALREWGIDDWDRYEAMIFGAFEAFFSRWRLNRMLHAKVRIMYGAGVYTFIEPCPLGEEQYIHDAVCQILARRLRRKASA